MRIAIVTDAWFPQVNGVVRTLSCVTEELRLSGHEVRVFSPEMFRSIPCPGYSEIRLSVNAGLKLPSMLEDFDPDALHIAVEGPLGLIARRFCLRRGLSFTTAYHTKFPEYLYHQFGVPQALTYAFVRRFHGPSAAVMVATASLETELKEHGFKNLVRWSRGVDTNLFTPTSDKSLLRLPRPIWLYVGRVSVEKNIQAFLKLNLPGSKLVVGSGPQLDELKRCYPQVCFAGQKVGEELALHYAASDVFVFPSKSDTYGLVMLEALASGLPVAAYPVTGPIDVITSREVGCLDDDLQQAAEKALMLSPAACREFALAQSWQSCAEQFATNLVPCRRQPSSQATEHAVK